MEMLEKYPTTGMFLSFFIFSCIFAYCPLVIKSAFIILSLVIFIVTPFIKTKSKLSGIKIPLLLVFAAILVSTLISIATFDIHAKNISALDGEDDYVTLSVQECEYSLSYSSCYTAKVTDSEKLPQGTKILITTELSNLSDGAILQGHITYVSLKSRNDGEFNGERYYMSQGVMLEAEDVDLSLVSFDNTVTLDRIFRNINKRLTAMIVAHCGRDAGGIAAAVLLGNKEYLSDLTQRDYRRIGITHLLVVSGSHFAIFIAFADSAMRKFRLKRALRCSINICFILFLMALTGFSPSVLRAGIMHLISQLATLLLKKATPINSLAIAGTIIVILNPYSVLDCGMQLSFVAAYSCIAYQKLKTDHIDTVKDSGKIAAKRRKGTKVLFGLVETILLTSLINLCTLPLIWLYFGQFSVISVLSNIIFIPLITVLMYLTAIYLITYPITFIIPLTSLLINYLCSGLNTIAAALSSWKFTVVSVNYPFAVYFLVPVGILFVLLPAISAKRRPVVLSIALSMCVVFFGVIGFTEHQDKNNVTITYITEKKNDGIVIKSNGRVLLCDVSDGSYSFAKNLTVEASDLHLTEIESLLFTHYHSKHAQLLGRICSNNILREIILPEPIDEREEAVFDSLINTAEIYGINYITVPSGGSFVFGDAVIHLFERTYLSRSTHPITAVRIEVGDDDYVFLSSSFNEALDSIISAAENAEYLVFGVHSPVYKKTFGLNLSVEPKAVVYSKNSYEHMDVELQNYINSLNFVNSCNKHRVIIKVRE